MVNRASEIFFVEIVQQLEGFIFYFDRFMFYFVLCLADLCFIFQENFLLDYFLEDSIVFDFLVDLVDDFIEVESLQLALFSVIALFGAFSNEIFVSRIRFITSVENEYFSLLNAQISNEVAAKFWLIVALEQFLDVKTA